LDIFNTTEKSLIDAVSADVEISESNLLLLHDRKIMYQYSGVPPIDDTSLVSKIAQRPTHRCYINQKTPLIDIMQSLQQLGRLPTLMVFDGRDRISDNESLTMLVPVVDALGLSDRTGIYFRYRNGNAWFNSTITERKLNHSLDSSVMVAGLSKGVVPKFIIEMQWKPKSIISFSNVFKNNLCYRYFNTVDLILYYNKVPPLDKDVYALM